MRWTHRKRLVLVSVAILGLFVVPVLWNKIYREPKLIGYFCSSNGHILSRIAEHQYTHIVIAFVAPDPHSGEMGFVCGEGVNHGLTLSHSVADGIRELQQKGVKVMVSFGGGTMHSGSYAAWSDRVPELAQKLAAVVRSCPTKDGDPVRFDGLDIDWEDSSAFTHHATYDGRKFLIALTKELRRKRNLPASKGFLLTHTPQPPYLTKHGGMNGYVEVWNEARHHIDWLQMQYYNNPGFQDADQLLAYYHATIKGWPEHGKTPAFSGIPSHQFLVGKPILKRDASSGHVPVDQFIHETIKPLKEEYRNHFGGVFAWQILHDQQGDWSNQVAETLFD